MAEQYLGISRSLAITYTNTAFRDRKPSRAGRNGADDCLLGIVSIWEDEKVLEWTVVMAE